MIRVRGFSVNLGDFQLRDIDLDIERGEYFVILGPTGAGKTVLLEAMAGLHPIESGRIWMDGEDMTFARPEKRGIGFAYQDYSLFPHLSVRDNIGYGLRRRGMGKDEINARVLDLVSQLRISHLLGRSPKTLSGGEAQRVALARALAIEPDVLFLDEPLGALDPQIREAMRRELRLLHQRFGTTTVHVTHDFEEAVSLGDRIAVLGEGRLMQVGTPEQIFRQPKSEFVARFALTRNIFRTDIEDGPGGNGVLALGAISITTTSELRGQRHACLRPEDILVSSEPLSSSARNSFRATISHVENKGSVVYLTVSVPPDFVCLITHRSFEDMDLREGTQVFITFKASAVHVF